MHNLRIITPDSPGLLNDATIYKQIFEINNYQVEIFIQDSRKIENTPHKKYDINLFLERIHPKNYTTMFPSSLNLLMPNQELFISFQELENIHYVLCKSKIALSYFKHIKKEKNYNYICFYTKFTTKIPKELKNRTIDKNKNLFVHLAGKSAMKNTEFLIHCWIKNDGFIDIDPNIELHITCYRSCFKKMIERLKEYHNFNFQLKSQNDVIIYKNMHLHNSPAPKELYEKLLTTASVAVCISLQEGFGHYINEARYFETFIISLDAPPMNELVKDNKNGVLIHKLDKSHKEWIGQFTSYKLYKVYPDIDELKEKLIYCIKNKDDLHELGKNGRDMYFKDKKYFIKKMNKIINKNIYRKLKKI